MAVLSEEECIGERSPGRLIRSLNKLLLNRIESRFTDETLNFVEWMVLKLLWDGIASTPGELSRHISVNSGATTRLIDGLETAGLIERDRDSPDRRVISLRLTDAGRAKYREKIPLMVSSWNEVLESFSQDEANALLNLMGKLQREMDRADSTR